MNVSVIIPVYKNLEQFFNNLKHNLQYLKDCEVILVNDYPTESIVKEVKKFPHVKLLENDKNLGFGSTVNRGVKEATHDYVMLLNTDVVLKDNSFKNALKHFEDDETLFGVSFAQLEKDNTIVGKNRFFWKKGLFFHTAANNLNFGYNGWAEGGTCMIDRSKFVILEGFDPIYKPFYWEDIDLSYRAWKRGFKIVFDPEILVEHHHEGTTGKYFLKSHVETVAFRNQFFFIWKNITDKDLCIQHALWFIPNILFYLLKGKLNYIKGLGEAVSKLFDIFTNKAHTTKLGDKEVFEIFKEKI